jgi:hypothetical protein
MTTITENRQTMMNDCATWVINEVLNVELDDDFEDEAYDDLDYEHD